MFDCIIIGAGVNGTCIAYNLAKYKLDVLVIEKENDVGNGSSCANSAIIHSGYDPIPHTKKAKLNVLGNKLYEEICSDLDVEFKRIGSITLAINEDEVDTLEELAKRSKENGVVVRILDADELRKVEPFVTKKAIKGLLAESAGVINPFELCVAFMENAMDNGVKLKLDEPVINIIKNNDYFVVKTSKDEYKTKAIINCAGLFADEINNFVNEHKYNIKPRKGEYFVLDHFENDYITHTLFNVPTKAGKGVLITPTTHGNILIGPSSLFIDEKNDVSTNKETLDDVLKSAYNLVDYIPMNYLIREFAGVRAYEDKDDFIIESLDNGFINVLGMQSPGLASAPATALEVIDLLKNTIKLIPKENYIKKRKPLIRLNKLSVDERIELTKKDIKYGKMVCRCEQVSEAEIIDCINRNCGATTVKGVKKRVRPGFGKCQGGFCEPLVIKILAKELHKNMEEIRLDKDNSYILLAKMKEKDND